MDLDPYSCLGTWAGRPRLCRLQAMTLKAIWVSGSKEQVEKMDSRGLVGDFYGPVLEW